MGLRRFCHSYIRVLIKLLGLQEDPANLRGGKFILRLRKGVADRIWEEFVSAMVGQRLFMGVDLSKSGSSRKNIGSGLLQEEDEEDEDPEEDVVGAVMSVRKDEAVLSVSSKSLQTCLYNLLIRMCALFV